MQKENTLEGQWCHKNYEENTLIRKTGDEGLRWSNLLDLNGSLIKVITEGLINLFPGKKKIRRKDNKATGIYVAGKPFAPYFTWKETLFQQLYAALMPSKGYRSLFRMVSSPLTGPHASALHSHMDSMTNFKGAPTSIYSHELRTPMAAVIGLLDILLCDEYLTTEQIAMVSQIRHCSTSLLRLLNNILDLSKV
eukprot:Gb_07927 [translate_table: standard]